MGGNYSISPMMNNMQTLRNYEYMLYGGSNYGTSAPSYTNNYMGLISNNSYYPYANYNYANGYNPSFNGYSNSYANTTSNSANTNFQGLTDKDWQVLKNTYNKGLSPSESIGSALTSGVVMAATMNNPRITVHPINTIKSLKGTNALFADCKKEGTALYNLWRGQGTNGLLQDAYAAMNKLEARQFRKLGAFRKSYSAEDYNKLKSIMESALKSGDTKQIADATATLKNAYVTDGWLAKLFKKAPSVSDAINDTASISAKSAELLKASQPRTFKEILSKGAGVKGGLAMMALEMATSIGKFKTAFSKDTSTGLKQVGQSVVKSAGTQVGWMLGDAAAVWAMGKWGAKIGSMFGPGIGTIIGAVAGVLGGSVGMWAMGKITRALVGQDVADKIETDKLATTAEGQQKLLQYAFEKAQKGEKMDAATQQVVQKAINLYA